MTHNKSKDKNPLNKVISKTAREFASKRNNRSAMDSDRAEESKSNFSEKAQDSFGKNERGSEDLMDMYEKGAFD